MFLRVVREMSDGGNWRSGMRAPAPRALRCRWASWQGAAPPSAHANIAANRPNLQILPNPQTLGGSAPPRLAQTYAYGMWCHATFRCGCALVGPTQLTPHKPIFHKLVAAIARHQVRSVGAHWCCSPEPSRSKGALAPPARRAVQSFTGGQPPCDGSSESNALGHVWSSSSTVIILVASLKQAS